MYNIYCGNVYRRSKIRECYSIRYKRLVHLICTFFSRSCLILLSIRILITVFIQIKKTNFIKLKYSFHRLTWLSLQESMILSQWKKPIEQNNLGQLLPFSHFCFYSSIHFFPFRCDLRLFYVSTECAAERNSFIFSSNSNLKMCYFKILIYYVTNSETTN